MNFVCIIPSRYASTRLPGKPLCDIAGKPMVQRVYEQAAKASKLTAVVVAVDNPKVYDTVVTFGGHAVMTREDHANGTDRLAEAVGHFPDADVIVNVQGDEPLIAPDVIASIQTLKTDYMKSHNPRLHTDEMLVALAISAASDHNAMLAMQALDKLKKCEAHSTVILSSVDDGVFKRLGMRMTCEPIYEKNSLYHK